MSRSQEDALVAWRAAGARAIAQPDDPTTSLPWNFERTVFPCAWEYPATDFEAEIGFHREALGFRNVALNHEYALFTTPEHDLALPPLSCGSPYRGLRDARQLIRHPRTRWVNASDAH